MGAKLRRISVLGAVAMAVSAALVPAARAVDGVIEINQARALAGHVTLTDEAGFPVTLDSDGSYRLTGDLTVPAFKTAIEVTGVRRDIAIDLNGFAIRGPVQCTPPPGMQCTPPSGGDGILNSDGGRLHVFNGVIRGMGGEGISSENSSVAVEAVHLLYNRYHGILAGDGSLVSDSVAEYNGDIGIRVGSGSIVRASSASHNGVHGIYALFAATLVNCNTFDNQFDGIVAAGYGGTVTGNTSFSNRRYGIWVEAGATVLDNAIRSNTDVGFFLQSGSAGYARNVFTDNNGGDAHAQVGGDSGAIQIGTNICGATVCP